MVTYEKLKADEKNLEIVFISSDRSEASFTEYYGSMPGWFALPYKDERCIQLTRLFGITGKMPVIFWADVSSVVFVLINPFNAGCSKLLLFKGFSAILV